MKLRSLGYQIRQGFRNISRNKMFSVASVATMTASIFLFGALVAILMNVDSLRESLENRIGITVFFEKNTEEKRVEEIGKEIRKLNHVTSVTYTSAEEAWEQYKEEYFSDNPELAEGFRDNPLADSASYTVLVDRIENQDAVAEKITAISGVRKVNRSSGAAENLQTFNRFFAFGAAAVIAVLLIVTVVLISNTVNMGITVRREQIAISKLIGATDSFVRAPFIVEGLILGLIGSLLPLAVLYLLYSRIVISMLRQFGFLASMGNVLLSANYVFQFLLPCGVLIGMGVGLIGSVITVKRHLAV
ncbi:MAG: permease-like cell division protein FtsX [Lachnospiraceae bacterium]|nr:permease-like cell division protein FtsX [Lachnospiraceae bacterium]